MLSTRSLPLFFALTSALAPQLASATFLENDGIERELQVISLDQYVQDLRQTYRQQLEKAKEPELTTLSTPLAGEVAEVVLRLNYSLKCTGDAHFVMGNIAYQGRRIRVLLFEGTEVTEAGLGRSPEKSIPLRVSVRPEPDCTLKNLEVTLDYVRVDSRHNPDQLDLDRIALEHAPFLTTRSDLITLLDETPQKSHDLPLSIGYHVRQDGEGHMTLVYTLYITNWEEQPDSPTTELRYARKGTATEVQWIYEVSVDRAGQPARRAFRGPGGARLPYPVNDLGDRSTFLAGGMHPVIQLLLDPTGIRLKAGVNQPGQLDGFQLVPRVAVPERFQNPMILSSHRILMNRLRYPFGREWLLFSQPWMLRATDLELKNENKLPGNFSSLPGVGNAAVDYLYVFAYGTLGAGKIRAVLDLENEKHDQTCHFESARKGDGVSVMGEGMWGKQAVLALPLGRETLNRLYLGQFSGTLRLVPSSGPDSFKMKESPRIIMLREEGRNYVTFQTDPSLEVTRRFNRIKRNPNEPHTWLLTPGKP